MHDKPPPISARQQIARQARAEAVAREIGFVGAVEYRHVSTGSGGAQYGMAPTQAGDLLVVYPKAFERDSDPTDFSLEAIIAHERGHQIISRHEVLLRTVPDKMSEATEEVLASLVGSLVSQNPKDGQDLVLKALFVLIERGMRPEEAFRRVEETLVFVEAVL